MKKKNLILMITAALVLVISLGIVFYFLQKNDDKNKESKEIKLPTTEFYNDSEKWSIYDSFRTTAGRAGENNVPRYRNYNSYTLTFHSKIKDVTTLEYKTVDAFFAYDHIANAYKYQNKTLDNNDNIMINDDIVYTINEYNTVTSLYLSDNTYVNGEISAFSVSKINSEILGSFEVNAISLKNFVGSTLADWRIFQDNPGQLYMKKFLEYGEIVWELEIYFENYLPVMYRERVVSSGEEIKYIYYEIDYSANFTIPNISDFVLKEME